MANEESESKTTTDHKEIKSWVEARGGRPARVRGTGGGDDIGLLRIDFGDPDPSLEEISWDEFFEEFEKNKLAFLYQEKTTDGQESRFFKFIKRN
jgi:hypothetical protein